jgi:aryl-alcohol dehydrogenase-like predicted oxidoreductase
VNSPKPSRRQVLSLASDGVSLFSRDAEEQGQINACKELDTAMMAYAVAGRGMLSSQVPKVEEMAADDIRRATPFPQHERREKPPTALGA